MSIIDIHIFIYSKIYIEYLEGPRTMLDTEDIMKNKTYPGPALHYSDSLS